MRDRDDVFVPASWRPEPEIIAYSREGYDGRTWALPRGWPGSGSAAVRTIGLNGLGPVRTVRVTSGQLTLSLRAGEAASITPR